MSILKEQSTGRRGGQSLLDVLIGLALVTIVIAFGIILVFGGQNVLTDRESSLEAQSLAAEGIDGAREVLHREWDEIADGTYGLVFASGTWAFSGTEDVSGAYRRKIAVATAGEDEREVKSEVTWQTENLRMLEVEYVTKVTIWRTVLHTGGDTGGGGPSGNWQNPQSLGSADVGSGNQATDIDVVDKIVYISTAASSKSKPDIHAFDVLNPAMPILMDNIEVNAYAVESIDWNGNYVYGASTGVIPDLKIVEAANPNNLLFTGEYNVITFVNALSVFKDNQTVYLGTQKTSWNGELFSIDASNPGNPSQLDVYEANADANDIFVKDDLLYLPTSNDNKELIVLDVSNPSNLTEVGFLNLSGGVDAKSIFVMSPDRVFVGVGNSLYVVDATNPAAMTVLGQIDAGGSVNDIYAVGYMAFLATSNSNSEFQVINITDPQNPVLWSSLNFPQVATGVDYEDNVVYVSVRSNDGLRIITSQ